MVLIRPDTRHHQQNAVDEVSDSAGGDAGNLDERSAGRIYDVGHRSPDSGKQVAHASARQGSLHLSEVYSSVLTPRDPLIGDGRSVHLNGVDQAKEQERRKQRPEVDSEVEPQIRYLGGKPDPLGIDHSIELVDSQDRGDYAATDYPDQRPPESQRSRAAKHERRDDYHGSQGG